MGGVSDTLDGDMPEIMEIVSSPCAHLETCVSWYDDDGNLWAGPIAKMQMEAEMAEMATEPEANILQRRVEQALRWCKDKGIPARIIVLKGRRAGCSLICGKVVDLECRVQKTKALVMADVFKRSDEIFDLLGGFATSDVFPWGFGAQQAARTISYGNGSMAKKDTALDPNAGRGGGYRVLWFSEPAHYPTDGVRNAKKLMEATLNAVSKKAGSIVIAESTANGQSGWFYDRWNCAAWPEYDDYFKKWDSAPAPAHPDEMWIRVFAAWFETPRNAKEVEDDEERARIVSKLTPAEKAGVERYGWTAEQLKWRRFTVRNDFNGDESRFDQEYPSDPNAAFVASGSPAFSRESLATLRAMATKAEPLWKYGVLEPVGATPEDVLNGRWGDASVIFRETPMEEAWVKVLESPLDDLRYMGWCDPSTGADVTDGEGNLDNTSIGVLRAGYTQEMSGGKSWLRRPRVVARIMREVMTWHPGERTTIYMMSLLMRWYGNCTLVVETNKGEWVVMGAKQAGLNLYRQQIFTQVTDKLTSQLGFGQTEETRHSIITRLQSLVHGSEVERDGEPVWEPGIEVEDLGIVEEMETFVRSNKGRFAAANGKHDDDVLGLAMAAWLIEGATRYRTRKRARR